MFVSKNTSTPGYPSVGTAQFVTSGWGTVTHRMSVDWDGDGKADIIGVNGNSLLVWRSSSTSTSYGFNAYTNTGTGVSTVSYFLQPADFNGDGKPDLALFNSTGDQLFITKNTSTPGTASAAAGQFVSSGWGSVDDMMDGYFTTDNRADILGRSGDGLLEWSSTSTTTTFSVSAYTSIGSGNSSVSDYLTTNPVA